MINNIFVNEVNKLKIKITNKELDLLEQYYNFLIKYNEHTNITAITKKEDVYIKHFLDSLMVTKVINFNNIDNLIDIGSGAGFPGIVLKIFFPNIKIILLDSNNKKTTFLNEVIKKLNLKDIEVVNLRAEEYMKNHLNEFDICISRAVAYIDIITTLSLPFIKPEGKVVLMKGNYKEEIDLLNFYKEELYIKNINITNYNLLNNEERKIIIIDKNKNNNSIVNYATLIKKSELRRKKFNILNNNKN